jgi:hypothetical protein
VKALAAVAVALGLAACGANPTPTGSECPPGSTLRYDTFAAPFFDKYCTGCHDSSLHGEDRHGAPLYHDFDTLVGVLDVHGHVDEQAAAGPDSVNTFMPPNTCPDGPCDKPSLDERYQLGEWLACAVEQIDDPPDAGPPDVDAAP